MTQLYITHVSIGAGGSYAKGATPQATAERCAAIIRADWSGLFDVAGRMCRFPIWELPTDPDTPWYVSDEGFRIDGEFQAPVEYVELAIPEAVQ